MKVLVDGMFLTNDMKGVGRYVYNFLREIARSRTEHEWHVLVPTGNGVTDLPVSEELRYHGVRQRNHFVHGFVTLPHKAKELEADVAFIPYETTMGKFGCPYSVLFHDVPAAIEQAQRSAGEVSSITENLVRRADRILIARSARRAELVFHNSAFVGRWLREELAIDDDRLALAPCSLGADFVALSGNVFPSGVRERLGCPEGYILAFYTSDKRENLKQTVNVFRAVLTAGHDINLVVAGVKDGARDEVDGLVRDVRQRVRIVPFLGFGEEERLAELYASALIYLDLSLHEGFGMQVIEAMASGTPVVCSSKGALPEVAGDAAVLVDPNDANQVAQAVAELVSSDAHRRQLTAAGRRRAGLYSWRRTAAAIVAGLEKVARPAGSSWDDGR